MFRTICLLLIPACLSVAAAAETNRAFIVGVGEYAELTDLQKTVGDANGYAGVFAEDLNFDVTPLINPDTDTFLEQFDAFLQTIEPGDRVAFIFSGHGWSDGGQNYLALSDAPYHSSLLGLRKRTISLSEEILDEIRARQPEMVFAVVDACRDNPFDTGTRSMTKGMARTGITSDTLVVYAAGANQMALDRLGPEDEAPYSVFTRSLLPKLRDPNFPLSFAVGEASEEVAELAASVEHSQKPAVYSDVDPRFCFSGQCQFGEMDQEEKDWIYISSAGYVQMDVCSKYSEHLEKYPDGKFAAVAKRYLSNPPCAVERLKLESASWYADLQGHTDEIYGLDYSPSGRFLASASADNTARIWVVGMSPSEFGELTVLEGHTEPLLSVQFSPDEEYVVTASQDDTARIWRAVGGPPVQVLTGHTGDVSFADFSPDGERVVTASYDGTVRVWEVATGEEAFRIDTHSSAVRSVHYSPLGNRLLTASNDGTVRLFNSSNGSLVRTIESGPVPATYAESDDTADRVLVASADGSARIWSDTGEPIELEGHDGPLWNAAFSPDGEMVVTSADDLSARLWDARNGAMLAKLQDLGAFGANWAVFSPDGKMVAAAMKGAHLQLWQLTFETEFAPEEAGEPAP
jgi:hypothetical protein